MSAYILSGTRTPHGTFLGNLSSMTAPELGGHAISNALDKANIKTDQVDEVFMGNVLSAGIGQAPARQAALKANLPETTPCTTVNKVCGSGLKTIIMGAQSILTGDNEIVVSGGMENMSLAPHFLPNSRSGYKFGSTEVRDSMQWDGLRDVYTDRAMGNCAEECVKKYSFTREEQDAFAIRSFERAQQATSEGIFKSEISPITLKSKKGDLVVDRDEGAFLAKFDKIPSLRPAFEKTGTITAANASTINDGASAVVLGGEIHKKSAKFEIISYAAHAHNPTFFTTAPIFAMEKCLEKANMSIDQIDLFEINEAFAVVTMATIKELKLDSNKVNIFGGAVSLGHPIGSSGTRIVVTLMNAMERKNAQYGMASICIGGGEALAMIIKNL